MTKAAEELVGTDWLPEPLRALEVADACRRVRQLRHPLAAQRYPVFDPNLGTIRLDGRNVYDMTLLHSIPISAWCFKRASCSGLPWSNETPSRCRFENLVLRFFQETDGMLPRRGQEPRVWNFKSHF